jgi:HlyD family secretion protein
LDAQRLFRKAALEKLSSPERLDVMMKVTSPAAWLALASLGAILVVAIIWSFVGSISIKVHGKGILIRGEAVLDVSSGASGRLAELLVKENEVVRQGDVVARLFQPELDEKIRNKKSELAGLIQQAVRNRRDQGRIISRLQAQAAEYREKIATQEKAVERGLLTRSTLLTTKGELTSTEQQIAQTRADLGEKQNRIENVRREISEMESQLGSKTEIMSPYTGRVLEIAANVGDLISQGNRIVTLEAFEEPIEAVIYIPAGDGKKVRPGMRAQISPSTVKSEEYGFIIGEVEWVSDFPVTPEGLKKVLRNEKLVSDLTGQSAPIEVEVKLLENTETESGFEWSSSKGPPIKVFSGTVCNANVTVEKKRPISYVLPIVRAVTGIG